MKRYRVGLHIPMYPPIWPQRKKQWQTDRPHRSRGDTVLHTGAWHAVLVNSRAILLTDSQFWFSYLYICDTRCIDSCARRKCKEITRSPVSCDTLLPVTWQNYVVKKSTHAFGFLGIEKAPRTPSPAHPASRSVKTVFCFGLMVACLNCMANFQWSAFITKNAALPKTREKTLGTG